MRRQNDLFQRHVVRVLVVTLGLATGLETGGAVTAKKAPAKPPTPVETRPGIEEAGVRRDQLMRSVLQRRDKKQSPGVFALAAY